jgi:hypothetical protein
MEQLKKLQGRSAREIKVRTQQEIAKLAGRLFITRAGEMSDGALYREFRNEASNGTSESAIEMLLKRLRTGSHLLLSPLAERRRIVELMNRRFNSVRNAIIASSDKAIAGKFDLLGFTDLDFGNPIDWHLDPTSGARAPHIHWSRIDPVTPAGKYDLKVVWEINRTAHFVTLGQSYRLTEDHRYAEEFVKQASSWIDANPAGMGVAWAASLDVALRAIAWLWALHLCADSRAVAEAFVARLVKSLIEHGRHIEKYLSLYFSPNTHLTGEALGLFYLGVALPELRRAESWRRTGLQILLEQLPKHVRKDGVYFEQATYYHRYTADFYIHLLALINANGIAIKREDEQMLRQMLEGLFDHLMWIRRPDGSWPLVGDDDGGRLIKFAPRAANDFSDTLAAGAAIFKRGDWKRAAGEAPAEMLWMFGAEGVDCYDCLKEETPRENTHAFETSGYFVMRDGWERDSSFALIDCGRHGSEIGLGHAHSDALAIELALRGTTWLIDPGTFVYGADVKTRDWFRSTIAHNTARVDGQDQSLTCAPFAWQTTASCNLIEFEDCGDYVVLLGTHDGYRRLGDPVMHTRSVMMLRKQTAFIISDRFDANKRHDYAVRYHFTSGCEANAFDNRIEARMLNGETLIINFFATGSRLNGINIRVEDGWVSTCYGQRTEAPVAVFEVSGDGPVEITTVICVGFVE